MATKKSQRIGILIIAVVMLVGTLGSFAVMMLSTNNAAIDQAAQEREMADYQAQIEEQAKARLESSKPLKGYEANEFDKSEVTELEVKTLKEGDGDELTADSTIEANYFGWTSDGQIFDSSNQNGTTKPIEFPLSGVIAGWTEGLDGVRVGSVVELTIPAEQAYGSAGSPPNIGPDEPLKFIVEVVSKK